MPTRGHKVRSPRWGMEEELGTRVAVPSATLFPSFLPSSFPKRLYSPRIIFNYFICARIYFRLIVRTLIPSPIYSLFELVIDFIVDYSDACVTAPRIHDLNFIIRYFLPFPLHPAPPVALKSITQKLHTVKTDKRE